MESNAIRLLIQEKLADGLLPHNHIPRVWGGLGAGEMCDGCDEVITTAQLMMEGSGEDHWAIRVHVECFYLWDSVREASVR
jgi:hypothetical protein